LTILSFSTSSIRDMYKALFFSLMKCAVANSWVYFKILKWVKDSDLQTNSPLEFKSLKHLLIFRGQLIAWMKVSNTSSTNELHLISRSLRVVFTLRASAMYLAPLFPMSHSARGSEFKQRINKYSKCQDAVDSCSLWELQQCILLLLVQSHSLQMKWISSFLSINKSKSLWINKY